MDIKTHGKTINDLPNEVLIIIFRNINIRGRLRTGRVCARWLEINNYDAKFMNTVNLKANQRNFQQLYDAGVTNLMRPYRVVTISDYIKFSPMTELKIGLLKHVRTLVFNNSYERLDIVDFEDLWEHCKQLKKVEFLGNVNNDNNANNINKYMEPIELKIDSHLCKSINCFSSISQLKTRYIERSRKDLNAIMQFLVAHGQAISEMRILDVDLLELINNNIHQLPLKLKSLHIDAHSFYQPFVFEENIEQLINSQQKSLVEFIMVNPTKEVLDLVRERLINLTTVKVSGAFPDYPLNDLRVLPNLRSLSLHIYGRTPYELDIWQLALTELDVDGFDLIKTELHISPNKTPMNSLRKLTLQDFSIHKKLMSDLAHCMPNLEVLNLPLCRITEGSSEDIAAEISKFSHLKSFVCNNNMINEAFLSHLRLSNLNYLKLVMQYDSGKRMQSYVFKRVSLDALADNCPSLTRILEKHDFLERKICFQRPNGTKKLRKVRYPKSMVHPLFPDLAERELDYDSVESCSDDSEGDDGRNDNMKIVKP